MSAVGSMQEKVWIPAISQSTIKSLFRTIKPVIRRADDALWYIRDVHPEKVSYLWSTTPIMRAFRLHRIEDIVTYHSFGYIGFFKPSIAEVLAQIPKGMLAHVRAFEIIGCPEDVGDLNNELEASRAGYHVATTRLYCRK
jgi:hypothetical protein